MLGSSRGDHSGVQPSFPIGPVYNGPPLQPVVIQIPCDGGVGIQNYGLSSETLQAWAGRTKAWQAPTAAAEFQLETERQELEADFQAFDKAVVAFQQYEKTLEQAELDNKLDKKDAKSQRTNTEAKLYLALRCQQLPEGIAKVGNYYV